MRLTCRNVLGMAPSVAFLLSMLLGVLEKHPTLHMITWGVALFVAHAWTGQVIMMLWVFVSSMSHNTTLPWRINVWAAKTALQTVLVKQCDILVNILTQLEDFLEHYKETFYPHWYVVLPIVGYLCCDASHVFYVLYNISGCHWNILVQYSFIVMLTIWALTCGIFARMIYVYRAKNLNYVQLEVDYMIWCVMYSVLYMMNRWVPDTCFFREWVLNEITWPRIHADMTNQREQVSNMNIQFNTVARLPEMPAIFHPVALAPQQPLLQLALAPQQPLPAVAVLRRSARLCSPRR